MSLCNISSTKNLSPSSPSPDQVKEVVHLEKKRRTAVQLDTVQDFLTKLHKAVNVLVSLVNMCKTHDKVNY